MLGSTTPTHLIPLCAPTPGFATPSRLIPKKLNRLGYATTPWLTTPSRLKNTHTRPLTNPPRRFCPNRLGARGLHPQVRLRAPTDETKASLAGNTKPPPPNDSARIARGLHPRVLSRAPAVKIKIPQTILPESPEGPGDPVGFINPRSLMDRLPNKGSAQADNAQTPGPA